MRTRPNRRRFLLGSASALAASAATPQSAQEIRTAFIGVGRRGGSLLNLSMAQVGVKVTAICDNYPLALDQALSKAADHKPRSFTQWQKIVDLKDVDAVYIAAPCYLHAEMAAACLDAGKHVYCEKPLGITPEGVARVLGAAQRSKAILQIGQQLRYYPSVREAIRQLHEDKIVGQIYSVRAQRDSGRSRPKEGGPQQTEQMKRRADWYADVAQSGDRIVENAVHNIDACNWIADSRPEGVYGFGKTYFPEPEPPGRVMMDGFSVEYVYDNDIHLQYSQLGFHPRRMKEIPNGMWYSIFGEKGTVFLTHSSATFYDIYGENEPVEMLPASLKDKPEDAVAQFFAAIRENRTPFADVRVGATAALTAIMGREAMYGKRMVTWKELGVDI